MALCIEKTFDWQRKVKFGNQNGILLVKIGISEYERAHDANSYLPLFVIPLTYYQHSFFAKYIPPIS